MTGWTFWNCEPKSMFPLSSCFYQANSCSNANTTNTDKKRVGGVVAKIGRATLSSGAKACRLMLWEAHPQSCPLRFGMHRPSILSRKLWFSPVVFWYQLFSFPALQELQGLLGCFMVSVYPEAALFPSTGTSACNGRSVQDSQILRQQCYLCSEFQLQSVAAGKSRHSLMMPASHIHR